jgi:hypothetical protein
MAVGVTPRVVIWELLGGLVYSYSDGFVVGVAFQVLVF